MLRQAPGQHRAPSRSVSRVLSQAGPGALSRLEAAISLGRRFPAGSSGLPGVQGGGTPHPRGRAAHTPAWPCSGRGLPGRPGHPGPRWALTPPFHPYAPLRQQRGSRSGFCGTFCRSPCLGVTQRPALWSPDFPQMYGCTCGRPYTRDRPTCSPFIIAHCPSQDKGLAVWLSLWYNGTAYDVRYREPLNEMERTLTRSLSTQCQKGGGVLLKLRLPVTPPTVGNKIKEETK